MVNKKQQEEADRMRNRSLVSLPMISCLVLGLAACSSSSKSGGTADATAPAHDSGTVDAPPVVVPDGPLAAVDATHDVALDTAPNTALDAALALDASLDGRLDKFVAMTEGQPASLWWEPSNSTLYIADNQNNQIWTWTEAAGLAKYATTAPTAGEIDAGATLVGQLVRQSDGTVVVARFGSPRGAFAAVAYILPDGGAGLVPGVDPTQHHLGLGLTAGDQLFGSYFAGTPGGAMAGAVTRIDLQTGETVYATGFAKIVGVLVANGKLYVSDQGNSSIYVLPLSGLPLDGGIDGGGSAGGSSDGGSADGGVGFPVLATLPVPDQICAGPDGSIFTGQFQAAPNSTAPISVRQIKPDGTVTLFRSDPDVGKPSGCAYDAVNRRLFVAESSTLLNGVHIFAVP
jgi:sugar lactone lactonase YvrE